MQIFFNKMGGPGAAFHPVMRLHYHRKPGRGRATGHEQIFFREFLLDRGFYRADL